MKTVKLPTKFCRISEYLYFTGFQSIIGQGANFRKRLAAKGGHASRQQIKRHLSRSRVPKAFRPDHFQIGCGALESIVWIEPSKEETGQERAQSCRMLSFDIERIKGSPRAAQGSSYASVASFPGLTVTVSADQPTWYNYGRVYSRLMVGRHATLGTK
jgi:hypothetical protein